MSTSMTQSCEGFVEYKNDFIVQDTQGKTWTILMHRVEPHKILVETMSHEWTMASSQSESNTLDYRTNQDLVRSVHSQEIKGDLLHVSESAFDILQFTGTLDEPSGMDMPSLIKAENVKLETTSATTQMMRIVGVKNAIKLTPKVLTLEDQFQHLKAQLHLTKSSLSKLQQVVISLINNKTCFNKLYTARAYRYPFFGSERILSHDADKEDPQASLYTDLIYGHPMHLLVSQLGLLVDLGKVVDVNDIHFKVWIPEDFNVYGEMAEELEDYFERYKKDQELLSKYKTSNSHGQHHYLLPTPPRHLGVVSNHDTTNYKLKLQPRLTYELFGLDQDHLDKLNVYNFKRLKHGTIKHGESDIKLDMASLNLETTSLALRYLRLNIQSDTGDQVTLPILTGMIVL